ncbi:MAG: DUF503 domain-containing protein [Christensenellales bacterium]|jgi:uncharacterized protein YlxP (DUF503 family)
MICTAFIVRIHMPYVRSLKEKRAIVGSVVGRLRSRFNGSFIQGGPLDLWQRADIGCALIAGSEQAAQRQKQAILDFLQDDGRFSILETEFL